ncbi:MAG: response regulator [Comamonadaceae bacterium]|nr:response regulator [Comamonadaceae bacterium]
MKKTVLIIEDDRLMRITVEDALHAAGYDVAKLFDAGMPALEYIKGSACDVVVTDVRLPDMSGIQVLEDVTRRSDVPVIVMTAFGTIKDAVQAMKLGAFDYVTKPFDLDEFLLIIERAPEVIRLREENIRLRRDLNRCYCFPNIVGESMAMKRVFSVIERVAASDATILIRGRAVRARNWSPRRSITRALERTCLSLN